MPAADVAFSYGHGAPRTSVLAIRAHTSPIPKHPEDLGVAEIPKGTGQTHLA